MKLLLYLTPTPTLRPGSLAYDWQNNRQMVIAFILIIVCIVMIIVGIYGLINQWGNKPSGRKPTTTVVTIYRIGRMRSKKRNYHTCKSRGRSRSRWK